MNLSESDLGRFSLAVQKLYAACDPEQLRQAMIHGLSELVPCDSAAYNELDHGAGRIFVTHNHGAEADRLFPALLEHSATHPVLQHWQKTGDQSTRKVSDFLTLPHWRDRAVCHEFFGRLGLPYQMAFALEVDGIHHISVTLQKSISDFCERDRDILNLLRPHFAQAFANAKSFGKLAGAVAAANAGLEASSQGLISFDDELKVRWISSTAEKWVVSYLGKSLKTALENLSAWARRCVDNIGTLNAVSLEQTISGVAGELRIRLVKADGIFLVLQEVSQKRLSETLSARGLTMREQQVLRWLGEAKADSEIAMILGISPRTVHKHVEHILRKLNLESRQNAILWLRDLGMD